MHFAQPAAERAAGETTERVFPPRKQESGEIILRAGVFCCDFFAAIFTLGVF